MRWNRRSISLRRLYISIALPRLNARLDRQHHGDEAQVQIQLARLVAFVSATYQQMNGPARWAQAIK